MGLEERLFNIRQGDRKIEEYARQFLGVARRSAMENTCLMVVFWGGLAEPFKSRMPYWVPEELLEDYINLALNLSGSAFRVELAAEPAPVQKPTESAPEPAPFREPTQSAPFREPTQSAPFREPTQSAPFREPTQSAPFREPTQSAPFREPTQSAPGPAPFREPMQSAPFREPTQSAPGPAPFREPMQSAPFREPTQSAPFREPTQSAPCPSPSHSPILALPDLVLGANSPLVSASLGNSDQAGLTVPASGQDLASSAGALEFVGMAHTGPRAVIDGLPAEVQKTIASARASATRKLYSSKWGVFESWCLTHAIDPVNCPVGPVLEFLQERLTAGAAATTLRVYVAAIAARRELDEIPLGRHRMVSAFMRGARRLRPVRPTAVPSWDLSVVLEGLVTAPFEPLESASDRILTLKVVLLLVLTSLKRVGDRAWS